MEEQLSFETHPTLDQLRYPSYAQLRSLFRTSLDILCSIDLERRFVHVSDACLSILGYEPEEMIGHYVKEFIYKADIERTALVAGSILRGEDQVNFENRYRHKNGSLVHLSWSCRWDAEASLIFCIGRDITEQKKAATLQAQFEQKIKQQHQEMTEMLERITDAFFSVDLEWRIVYANSQCERILDVNKENYLTRSIWSCFPELIGSIFEEQYRRAIKYKIPVYFEAFLDRFNMWFEITAYPSNSGLSVFFRDITEKRKAEEERKHMEEQLRRLSLVAKETNNAVSIIELDGTISWVNEAYTNITGYSFEEAFGNKNSELLRGPESNCTALMEMKRCFTACKPFDGEIPAFTKACELRWLAVTGQPLFDEQENMQRYFIMLTDITGRKRVEEELRHSNERFRLAANTDAIYDWDVSTNYLFWGEGLQHSFDYNTNELQIEQWMDALHPEERQHLVDNLYQTLNDPATTMWKYEYQMRRKDGVYSYVYERGQIVRNEEGKAVRMVGVLQDITERRLLAQELEYERKQTTAAVIKAQEQERSQIGRELHDNVNQILTSAKLYQELILSGMCNKEELVKKSMELLQEAINENRSLSKRLSAPTLGKINLVDSVKELVAKVATTRKFQMRLQTKAIRNLRISEELHLTIYRILQEQLTNILKYAEASLVQVAFSVRKDMLTLKITDNGIGFDTTQKRSGLGITNMMMRAQNVNGTLTIDSTPGNGCCVTAQFPIVR